jgi:hypothetical protein
MQITEIVSLNEQQLNEKLLITNIRNNLRSNINEYFIDLRLSTLLLEADEDLIGRSVAWLARSGDGVNGEIIGIGSGAQEGKVQVRGGSRNSRFFINPDKLLDPRTRTPLGITLGGAPATVAPTGDNDRPDNNDNSNSKRTGKNTKFAKAHFRSAFVNGPISLRTAFRRTWLFSLAAALALSVDWGTSDSEEGLDNPNSDDLGSDFGDTTLLYWYQQAEKGELYHFENTKAGAETYEDLDSQEQAAQHATKNKEMYQRMVALAYGSVCSIYYVSILTALLGPVYKLLKGTVQVGVAPLKFVRQPKVTARVAKANVLKFIKYVRRYRNIFTAASAAAGAVAGAGVGGIVTGLVSFILGTGALWVVEYILTRSGAAAKALEWMVHRMLEMDYNNTEILGFNVADTIAAAGGFTDARATEIVNSVTGDEETEVVKLTRDLLTNPQVNDTDIDAINVLTPSAAVSPSTNGSTVGPSSTGGDANSQIRTAVDDILK